MSEPITPADPPAEQPTDAAAESPPAEQPEPEQSEQSERTAQDYEAEIAKLRKEAANWRTKLREAEPKAKAYEEAEEAKKTEVQRATERAEQLDRDLAAREHELNVLRVAAKHGIPEDDHDLLGSGTPEELESRAARLAALRHSSAPTPAPPSDRPVEGLRPGASPTPPEPVDNSYPAAWKP